MNLIKFYNFFYYETAFFMRTIEFPFVSLKISQNPQWNDKQKMNLISLSDPE